MNRKKTAAFLIISGLILFAGSKYEQRVDKETLNKKQSELKKRR